MAFNSFSFLFLSSFSLICICSPLFSFSAPKLRTTDWRIVHTGTRCTVLYEEKFRLLHFLKIQCFAKVDYPRKPTIVPYLHELPTYRIKMYHFSALGLGSSGWITLIKAIEKLRYKSNRSELFSQFIHVQ